MDPTVNSENSEEEEAGSITTDLRWTAAITAPLQRQQGKHKHLLYLGRWHLVRENAICIRHNPICPQRIGVCGPDCVCVSDCVCVCVCVDAAERQKEERLSGIGWCWAGTASDKHTSLQAYLPD